MELRLPAGPLPRLFPFPEAAVSWGWGVGRAAVLEAICRADAHPDLAPVRFPLARDPRVFGEDL